MATKTTSAHTRPATETPVTLRHVSVRRVKRLPKSFKRLPTPGVGELVDRDLNSREQVGYTTWMLWSVLTGGVLHPLSVMVKHRHHPTP